MCINALRDCLDEIGPDQIICVRASPIQPLPVPHLRFRLLTPVENPHCYAMLCCAVCCLFLTPYPSRPVVSVAVVWPFNPFSWTFSCRLFLIFAFRDFRILILATGNWRRRPRTVQWKRRRRGEQQALEPGGRTADGKVIQAQHAHHRQYEA